MKLRYFIATHSGCSKVRANKLLCKYTDIDRLEASINPSVHVKPFHF